MTNPAPTETLPSRAALGLRRAAPVPAESCPMARAADTLGDRWTLLILRQCFYGVGRFEDIQSGIGISRAVLSERMSRLVGEGLLAKARYRNPGDRAREAYVLTERGRSLTPVFLAMREWGAAQAGS